MGKDEQLRDWLRLGGARQIRRGVAAEVYSVHGPERERETAAGGVTMVAYMLDPRLKLTVRQRATGRCYGAYTEETSIAGGSEFLRVYVDSGTSGGGGGSERLVQKMRMVSSAHASLAALAPSCYALGKPRGTGGVGPHKPITARFLLDAVAVNGWSLDAVGLTMGWWVGRRDKAGQLKRAVPDRQRKQIAEALRQGLDAIDAGWEAKGWSAPYEFGAIEVR